MLVAGSFALLFAMFALFWAIRRKRLANEQVKGECEHAAKVYYKYSLVAFKSVMKI